jgi:hypothetical protein
MYKILIALLLSSVSVCAQSTTQKKEFKNQGEQEDYWAQQLFEKHYLKQTYKRFNGRIDTAKNSYKYKDRTIEIFNTSSELKDLFMKGILYPSLIEAEFIISASDKVSISDLEEQKFLSNDPKKKRFKFLAFRKGFANPTCYFFELTNVNATNNTNMKEFINGSTLTFFKDGWIQI